MKIDDFEKAYEILKDYKGKNNQIQYYQYKVQKINYSLTEFDTEYILNNFDFEPYDVNKTVKIARDYGEILKNKYELDFLPEKIRITRVIGEMGESLHCYVQYRKSVKPSLMYVKKRYILNQLIDETKYNEVNVDFGKYDNITKEKDGTTLKKAQREGIEFLLRNKKCILADSMGTGKEQDVNTIMPTPEGYKRMGDLKVGDNVFASDGSICQVTDIFPQGLKDIYKVEFTDETYTNCGLEHLWIVKDKVQFNRKKDWSVLSAKQLIERGFVYKKKEGTKSTFKHNYKFRIPVCKPVVYKEQKHLIHPYLLGLMIGDGNLCSGDIIVSIPDNEIETLYRIEKLINKKYKLHCNRSGSCPNYRISRKKEYRNEKSENIYQTEIKRLKLDVKGIDKFIPQEYMLDSISNRIELLQGLMDSDGSITKEKNRIRYSTNSLKLAENVAELVQSLGGLAQIKTFNRTNKNTEYSVQIKIEICPFKLKRKSERYTIAPNKPKYLVKSIKNITFSHKSEAVCIKVNSKDSSYLTNNYIVTHNTRQAVVSSMETGADKILIICPASLKTNWKREICTYNNPTDVTIINGSEWKSDTKFTIINYDILDNFYKIPTDIVYEEKNLEDGTTQRVPVMVKASNGTLVPKTRKSIKKDKIKECLKESPLFLENFNCVIIDEAHKLSNNTSIRYKVISDFLKRSKIPYVFLLTGTPLTNRPMNLYHILKLIDAEVTRDYQYYVKHYCDGKKIKLKTGKEIVLSGGATNLDELKEKIKHVYIRRLLSEMTDMVNKDIQTRYYDLTPAQKKRYDELWEEYVSAQQELGNEDSEDYRQLVEGMLVRQYLAKEMIPNTIQLVDEKIEDDEKVIIICTFTDEINELKKYYGNKCVVYDGKMTAKQKDKAEYEFMNNPKIKVFIGQIIACSVGLTLTAAHTLVFNSYSWVAADNAQAEDRIYRLNQKNDVVCIYQLFNDSISQNMFDKVIMKKIIMNNVIKSEKEK